MPGQPDDKKLYGGVQDLWVFSLELVSCHTFSTKDFGLASAFGKFVDPLANI
jgi:hypothetical protein